MDEKDALKNEELFKPNSHKYHEEQKDIHKVVSSPVITRKKSPGKKFREIFLADDTDNVKTYVFYDIVVPAIKNTISDVIGSAVEMFLFGETKASKQNNKPLTYVSYNSYYGNKPARQITNRYSHATVNDPRDIILTSRAEAEQVISNLVEIISVYGSATVADLYDLVGITGSYTDNKYGWFDLGGANTRKVREGYLLDLPKATLLD